MKVLVTGGTGFLGSHLVDHLVELNHKVTVLDRRRTRNITHLTGDIEYVHGDIRNFYDCCDAVAEVDIVIHLAALINVDHSIETPLEFYETNVEGTVNMLEASRWSRHVTKFVYMSTAEVYGSKESGPIKEVDLCNPRSPYGASKYAAERYCLSYHAAYGRPEITVVRGFNLYGPRQRYGRRGAVHAIFITRLLQGKPPLIFGSGEQSRDYVYVKDVVKGVTSAALTRGIGGEIINLASGNAISINDITTTIKQVGGFTLEPEYVSKRPGEIKRSCGDTVKAEKLLNWKAETPYPKGLQETIEYYRRQIDE